MSDISIFFGNRIRELRKTKRLSQEEVAYRASISPTYLGQIERANKNPTLDTMFQIASALDTTISDLLRPNNSVSPVVSDTNVTIDKVTILLEQMSPPQQHKILKMIRIFSDFNSDEKAP